MILVVSKQQLVGVKTALSQTIITIILKILYIKYIALER